MEDSELMEELIGVVKTNSVVVGNLLGGQALFPVFSLLSHRCESNCRYAADRAGPGEGPGGPVARVQVRARRAVSAAGEELTIQYKSSLLGNARRGKELRRNWMFQCRCDRCSDPSEMGTFLSGVRCGKCPAGYLLCHLGEFRPADGVDEGRRICHVCEEEGDGRLAEELEAAMEERLRKTSFFSPLSDWESLLGEMAKGGLHPDHHLAMDVKRVIIQIIGNRKDLSPLVSLSDDLVQRKLDLCLNYLSVYERVDAGYTKWRGRLLEEMACPMVVMEKRRHARGDSSASAASSAIRRGLSLLREAFKCRQFEAAAADGPPSAAVAALVKEFNAVVAGNGGGD